MKPALFCAVLLNAALLFTQCQCLTIAEDPDTVVARVNQSTLTVDQLEAELDDAALPAATLQMRRDWVSVWIRTELLYQEALRRDFDGDGKPPDWTGCAETPGQCRAGTRHHRFVDGGYDEDGGGLFEANRRSSSTTNRNSGSGYRLPDEGHADRSAASCRAAAVPSRNWRERDPYTPPRPMAEIWDS